MDRWQERGRDRGEANMAVVAPLADAVPGKSTRATTMSEKMRA